ncbi:hypothetical protein ODU73_001825 [Thermoclostridium stercorarium]|uniref:hypothetical protein n=1 Tax=Clostridia TaxID=186801 RepID=UPI001F3B5503|nr:MULTISPECIES: hypothetical protein [Clostridia]MCG1013218.1 hypothetical protein [Tepidanaerobacter sp. GT38]UZQ84768.1 hypothetical protein ODU73_001825 [Thermoclostridium stercorarium]
MLRFKLSDYIINASNVNYGEPKLSVHTGKQLETLSFNLQIRGKTLNDAFNNKLHEVKNGGIFSTDNNGVNIKEYKLVNHSYSYTGNYTDENTIYTYTLYLEEIEKLKIDSLVIAGVEVVPYEFTETYDNAIIIQAKIKLSKKDAEKLDKATNGNKYFDVIRKGISDEVKKMRFGKIIWSENDGYIKKDIVLVEDIYDNEESPISKFFQPEFSNIMDILSYVKNLNDELLKLLVSKGQLSTEESEQIKIVAKNNIKATNMEYFRVEDIDKF